MEKWQNQRAWFLVMPVVLLVAFNALIPLMTVVNYSVQDIFDSTHRLFVGTEWYRETLLNTRLQNALLRQLVFSGLVLLIELPLGVAIALTMPRKGGWAISATLVIIALPLLIPWNVIGTIWVIFLRPDVGLLGHFIDHTLGIHFDYPTVPIQAWISVMMMRSGTGPRWSYFSPMPACDRFRMLITKPQASMPPRRGPSFGTSSCPRCAAC
jgi:glycerol transport system permease protein